MGTTKDAGNGSSTDTVHMCNGATGLLYSRKVLLQC